MEPSYSTHRDFVPRRPGRPGGRTAAVAALVAVGLLVTPSVGRAAPAGAHPPKAAAAPQLPADPQAELAELEARSAKLSKEYRGHLVRLDDAKKKAKRSTAELKKVTRDLEKARVQVARLAASQYMSGGLDPALTPLVTSDPDAVLDKAVIAEHLAKNNREKLAELSALQDRHKKTQRATQKRVDSVREEVDALEKKRHKVQNLIAKFGPEVPIVGDSVTPRMRQVRQLVLAQFGAPYSVGCYRAGGFGEHPLGRACDFMLSTGGAMPSAYQVDHGWEIANWARANASRLGIMYVIYRQQIWDIRRGGGWQMMEDRGSITANHYDHVHISVF